MTKPVRTYLDPDAVGPLPRSPLADDSDELAAARTMVRLPDSPTQEIHADDVIEIVDPHRKASSLAPVGYETVNVPRERRDLARYAIGALGVACVLLLAAVIRTLAAPGEQAVPVVVAAAALPPAALAPVARESEAPVVLASPPPSSPAQLVGTLRVEGVGAQRVFVDGVLLTASAALLRCGPHDVAVGAPSHARAIDVPCGGEVTVFR